MEVHGCGHKHVTLVGNKYLKYGNNKKTIIPIVGTNLIFIMTYELNFVITSFNNKKKLKFFLKCKSINVSIILIF